MKTRIAIVDDNSKITKSLLERFALFEEFEICVTAKNGEEICDYLDSNEVGGKTSLPEVILMDIEMPVMNGIEATAYITSKFPKIKILVLTVFDNDDKIFDAIKAGASGYFLKDESINVIVGGIEELLNGGIPMSRLIANKVVQLLKKNGTEDSGKKEDTAHLNLTPREFEILELLAKGMRNKQIADHCFVSISTVKKHIENIYLKLHISSRVEAASYIMKNKDR